MVFSVTELTVGIRDLLEAEFFEVWVEGELSNCRVWNTGHLYFTLKDSGAQVRGVVFRSALRYLKFKPADGLRVVARGRVSVYEPKGEYQLVCEHMEPHGLGALQLAFDQLKKRLQAEGLFDAARKRALPALPRKIGIVTSLDGAAIRDIINVLGRRYANAHLVIRPARVQGDGAALDIARALRAIGRLPGVDVIIVGRGGGSIEDLWAFNEEIVARAIAGSPVPVISAVGHETDVTIADFVADLRAPTPSAAAELVVVRKDEFQARINSIPTCGSLNLASVASARVTLSGTVHQLRRRFAGPGPGRDAGPACGGAHACVRARDARGPHPPSTPAATAPAARGARSGTRLGASARGWSRPTAGWPRRPRVRTIARTRASAPRQAARHPQPAVLGRATPCWTADGARGSCALDRRQRRGLGAVTLASGELDCEVRRTTT